MAGRSSQRKRRAQPIPTPRQVRFALKRKRLLIAVGALVGVLILARLDHLGLLLAPASDFDRYHGQTFTVLRVVDGDTLIIDAPDTSQSPARPDTRVRFWGINAPETAKPQRNLPAERGADAATQYLEQIALNRPITLYLEPHRPRGRFGRLLAHAAPPPPPPPAPNSAFPAKAPDPSDEPPPDFPARSLSHALVAVGLAKADNTWPHRFAEQLQAVEDQARADRLGLWSRQTELTPPSASSTQSPIPDRDSAAPPR